MSIEEIGQRLRLARDSSGLSLSQINERTKIPFNHLESIEQGHFDDLPEPVYVAGFIKRYADCVGLDAQQMVYEYRQELDSRNTKQEKPGFIFRGAKKQEANPPQSFYYNRQPLEQAPPNLMKMVPFYALWVVIILGLIIYLFNRQESIDLARQDPGILALKNSTDKLKVTSDPNAASSVKTDQNSPVGQTDTNNSNTETSSTATSDGTQAGNSGKSEVTLLAKKHVWVEVKANSSGEALYTGFMEGGSTHVFSDPEGLRIRAGNGGNLQVSFAGKTEDLGANGKISERTFANKVSRNVSISSSTDEDQNITNTADTSVTTKKTPSEKPTVTKKSPVANSTKKSTSISSNGLDHKQDIAHKYGTNEGISSEKKALDVPYRYSE